MTQYLTVSAKGQVTLKKPVLAHLGVKPGQRVAVDLKPGGGVELRPEPAGAISDVFGMLKRPGQRAATIEDMSEAIARGWAGECDGMIA